MTRGGLRLPQSRVAFLILAHDDFAMLKRLSHHLVGHDIYVHLDGRSSIGLAEIASLGPNIHVAEPRIDTYWADYTLVEATLSLLKFSLANGACTHFVLLSGHCYPIKLIAKFVEFLGDNDCANFMQLVEIGKDSFLNGRINRRWRNRPVAPSLIERAKIYPSKLDRFIVRSINRLSKLIPRDFRAEIAPWVPYYGSQWWSLTRPAAERLIYGPTSQNIHKSFRTAFAPDELLVQTVLGNSLDPSQIVGPNADRGYETVLDAPLHLVAKADGRWLQDTPEARAEIRKSDKFFVRKVKSEQRALLDWIDSELLK